MPARTRSACSPFALFHFVLILAILTGPHAAARQGTICTACGAGFLVHAFGGSITRNSGKCLDYEPERSGSAVFLNDCNVAHPIEVQEIPNQRHEVHLRAGTKVIGVRQPVVILVVGSEAPPAPELPLELQDPASQVGGGVEGGASPAHQTFALDGDSIILASNRNLVAKVQNARGTNGTPIVAGTRELADAEFWDMRALDGSGMDPTSAFRRVTTLEELLATVETHGCGSEGQLPCPSIPLDPGTVVRIDAFIELPPEVPTLLLPEGVTFRGDRRGTNVGPILSKTDATSHATMLDIRGSNVRITGLRLRGPNVSRSRADGQHQSNGIGVAENDYKGTIVDHNDIGDWTWRGVYVTGGENPKELACTDESDPNTRPSTTWVARNFIHHNLQRNKGYGVNANSGGFPLIEGNMFVSNRHAIAGTASTPKTGYRAWSNLVLSAAPHQYLGHFTHDFDMHGTGDNGFGGSAGGFMDVFRNTFLGTNRNNFEIRGTPCDYVAFRNNVSLQGRDDTVHADAGPPFGSVIDGRLRVSPDPNQFEFSNPTERLGVGDFDGDGRQDLFLATGTAWYFSPAGVAEWRFLGAKTDRFDSLRFGDFDGDGRTDVVGKNGAFLMASWGGASEWEKINETRAPINQLAIGDFDGSGRDDVFFADGQTWFVAFDGGPFVPTQTSRFRVGRLRFGDFDGDGRTDVLGVVSGAWRVSYGATSPWTFLRRRLTSSVARLVVADFDGNGRDDVATVDVVFPRMRWKFSADGVGGWTTLTTTRLAPAAIGRFLEADSRAGILLWNENVLWRAMFGDAGAPPRHSRQHMR